MKERIRYGLDLKIPKDGKFIKFKEKFRRLPFIFVQITSNKYSFPIISRKCLDGFFVTCFRKKTLKPLSSFIDYEAKPD